jgi:hypothetical protein
MRLRYECELLREETVMSRMNKDWDDARRSAARRRDEGDSYRRRSAAMLTAGVVPGSRISYRNLPVGGPAFTGVVVAGGCGDATCGFIHVDCDNGTLHHVDAESIIRGASASAGLEGPSSARGGKEPKSDV